MTDRVFCGQIAPLTSHSDLAVSLPPLFWSASIWCAALLLSGMSPARRLCAAETVPSKTTYQKAYGNSKGAPSVDAARELPRYPAVAPKDALKTWRVKAGFRLELAASEPQVRDPIAVC